MKKIVSILLVITVIFSFAQVFASASEPLIASNDSGFISVTVDTDKQSYGLLDTAKVAVEVKNNSDKELEDVTIYITSNDYALKKTTDNTVKAKVGVFKKGASEKLGFSAFVSKDMEGLNFFAKIIVAIKGIFTSSQKFNQVVTKGLKYVEKTFTVNHGSASPEFTVIVTYNFVDDDEYFTMGSYPMSKVTDAALISQLNSLCPSFDRMTSFGYYSNDGYVKTPDQKDQYKGEMKPTDHVKYFDVEYSGRKYRAIEFDAYRAYSTCYPCGGPDQSSVDEYGYSANTVYWFRFDPINWRRLDADTGLAMCATIIDSQPFNSFAKKVADKYYGDTECSSYLNNYNESSIREWLNNDFYNTAFTAEEKAKIKTTALKTESIGTSLGAEGFEEFDYSSVSDKVFLLSFDEVTDKKYGLNKDYLAQDIMREMTGTDYAKSQNLCNYAVPKSQLAGHENHYIWWLRSAHISTNTVCAVYFDGNGNNGYAADDVFIGVLPAICVNF